jgi:hypothetical protein
MIDKVLCEVLETEQDNKIVAFAELISTCLSDFEEKEFLKDIQKLIGKPIPVVENHKYPMTVMHVESKEKSNAPHQRRSGGNKSSANQSSSKSTRSGNSWGRQKRYM